MILLLIILFFILPGISPAYAETEFFDDFNGDCIDESVWMYPTGGASFNGRTQMRASYPSVSNGLLHLRVDTYDPGAKPPGNSFLGSEIITRSTISPGSGLTAEIRARMVTPVKGLVGGAFFYRFFSFMSHDEIDFELLINRPDQVQTNVYAGESLGPGHALFHGMSQFDITRFNTYRIEWRQDRLCWYVNNQLIRETATLIPSEAMAFHLNFYAPEKAWTTAYSASFMPASNPADNQTYFFDVDWVRILSDVPPRTSRLFNLAENNSPCYFAMVDLSTLAWSAYTYRYFADIRYYFGISPDYIYPDGVIYDSGLLSYWLSRSVCSAYTQPAIELVSVPEYGSFDPLAGRVFNADFDSHLVAVYIKVGSGWWTKPAFNAPFIPINADGTFTVDITTGGFDHDATEIAVFLVPVGGAVADSLPIIRGESALPSELYSYPNASVVRKRFHGNIESAQKEDDF